MTDLDSSLILGFGKHSSTTDLSSTPSFTHLLPEKWGFRGTSRTILARNPAHPQNKRFPGIAGPLDMGKSFDAEFILRGLSGNTGGAIASATTNDVAAMLDVIFGAAAIDPTGAVTTATGGTPASKILGVTEQARFPVGTVVMFQAPLGTFHVRQVRSRAGPTGAGNLTLDRIWVGAVAASQNVIRFSRWLFDSTIHEHTHGAFFAEYANDRRLYFGGMSSAQFDFTVGQYAKLMTSWQFTNITDDAETDPAFIEATSGGGLVNCNNSFWIGDTAFYATDMKLDIGGQVSPLIANSGVQGRQGYKVLKGAGTAKPRIMVRLQRGTGTGEIADSTGTPSVNALQQFSLALGDPAATLDIAFQVGGVASACGYFVAQNASCIKCDDVVVDGFKQLDCEFECNTPATGFGSVEVHLG